MGQKWTEEQIDDLLNQARKNFGTILPLADGGTQEEDGNFWIRKYIELGYEQAEKETVERAIAWLKEHANDYIVDLTPTYPDAPVNIIVGGMCWEDLKKAMEEE